MNDTLKIGLPAWVIQDGNYPDFHQGQAAAFALEFYIEKPLAVVSEDQPLDRAITHQGENFHEVVADVVFIGKRWCVLDAGIRLYSGVEAPAGWRVGMTVRGRVEIAIDSFAYVETFAKVPKAPPLIYDWTVDRIELDETPWTEAPGGVPQRDRARTRWRDIPATDAWNHDQGRAQYLITCTRQGRQSRHAR
jgi:hypothetical protein